MSRRCEASCRRHSQLETSGASAVHLRQPHVEATIIDINKSEGRAAQHLLMAGAPERTKLLVMFLKNRRRGRQKHVSEVPRAVSVYWSVQQNKHRDASADDTLMTTVCFDGPSHTFHKRCKAIALLQKYAQTEGPQALSQQTTVKARTIDGVTKTIIYIRRVSIKPEIKV